MKMIDNGWIGAVRWMAHRAWRLRLYFRFRFRFRLRSGDVKFLLTLNSNTIREPKSAFEKLITVPFHYDFQVINEPKKPSSIDYIQGSLTQSRGAVSLQHDENDISALSSEKPAENMRIHDSSRGTNLSYSKTLKGELKTKNQCIRYVKTRALMNTILGVKWNFHGFMRNCWFRFRI